MDRVRVRFIAYNLVDPIYQSREDVSRVINHAADTVHLVPTKRGHKHHGTTNRTSRCIHQSAICR